jgi:integrase
MARPKGEPSYLVHSRSGRAFTIIDRRQIPLGKADTPESRDRFDKVRAEWLANGRQLPQVRPAGSMPLPTGPTVAMLLDGFWRYAQVYYSKPVIDDASQPVTGADGKVVTEETAQLDHYRQVIRLLNRLYSDTATADFSCPQLEAVREEMIRMDWCRNHVNRQVSRVRYIFQWGVTKRLVPATVYMELKLLPGLRRGKTPARETRKVRPVEKARALAILPFVSKQVAAMIRLHLMTGPRSTELCIMRPCDIDRSSKPWVYRPMFHKTEEYDIDRAIILGPRARKILRPFLKGRAPTAFVFSPAEAEGQRRAEAHKLRKTRVQPSQVLRAKKAAARTSRQREASNRYDRTSYYNAIRRACEKAFNIPKDYLPCRGDLPLPTDTPEELEAKKKRRDERSRLRSEWHRINGWHPHQARHRGATDLRKAGGKEVAQIQLGHSNVRTTEIYAEADMTKANQIIEQTG